MYRHVFLISILILVSSNQFARPNDEYREADPEVVHELVMEFGANREFYADACCLIEMEIINSTVRKEEGGETSRHYDFVFHENLKSELKRTDLRFAETIKGISQQFPWSTFVEEKGKASRITFSGPEGFEEIEKKKTIQWHSYDPWVIPLADPTMIESGVNLKNFFWQLAFSEQRLLWAEENQRFIRGEWDAGREGSGRTRIQVYFDKNDNFFPAIVRYIDPPTQNESRFQKGGRLYETENNIQWKKLGKGLVPTQAEMKRISYGFSGEVNSIKNAKLNFVWDDEVTGKGKPLDANVFNLPDEKISAEVLYSRFSHESR